MKKKLITVLAITIVTVLSATTVFAASNLTDIEQKWLDFKQAVTDKMIEDGKITAEEAQTQMTELEEKLNSSEEDDIYNHFSNGRQGNKRGFKVKGSNHNIAEFYAELTDQAVEDVLAECKDNEKTLWQLAEENGVLDQLKEKVIEDHQTKLDSAIENGKITQEQADELMNKLVEGLENPDSLKNMMPPTKDFKKPMGERNVKGMGRFNSVDEPQGLEL